MSLKFSLWEMCLYLNRCFWLEDLFATKSLLLEASDIGIVSKLLASSVCSSKRLTLLHDDLLLTFDLKKTAFFPKTCHKHNIWGQGISTQQKIFKMKPSAKGWYWIFNQPVSIDINFLLLSDLANGGFSILNTLTTVECLLVMANNIYSFCAYSWSSTASCPLASSDCAIQ